MRRILLFLCLCCFSLTLLSGCADYYESKLVDAEVISKSHMVTEMLVRGKPKVSTSDWSIEVEYDGFRDEIKLPSDTQYEQIKVGQMIRFRYKEGYTNEGKLVSRSLSLHD